jgi:hypothetical protein
MGQTLITIYAPMNYTAPYVIFDAGSIHYLGKWEGVGPWKSRVFLGPVKRHRADRRGPFGAQPLPTCRSNGCFPHQKHYARGRINHRCIGGFMYKSPPWRGLHVHTSIICVHTSIPTCAYTYVSQR